MSKPWDNEPTPLTDAFFVETPHTLTQTTDPTTMRKACRDLERRMRAAERLLKNFNSALENGYHFEVYESQIKAHLETARKEDGQ